MGYFYRQCCAMISNPTHHVRRTHRPLRRSLCALRGRCRSARQRGRTSGAARSRANGRQCVGTLTEPVSYSMLFLASGAREQLATCGATAEACSIIVTCVGIEPMRLKRSRYEGNNPMNGSATCRFIDISLNSRRYVVIDNVLLPISIFFQQNLTQCENKYRAR